MHSSKFFKPTVMVVILFSGLVLGMLPSSLLAQDPLTEQEVEEAAELIRKAYDETREAVRALPRDRFEMDVLLEESDFDAATVAHWVADNIHWVPYQGVLRGANGVLLDRQGNSLDRSLLLAELLETAGYDTRLVQGQRSAEAIAQLGGDLAPRRSVDSHDSFFPEDVVAMAARVPGEADALMALAEGRMNQADTGMQIPTDHWWVEADLGGEWRTFDSIFSGELESMRPEPANYLSAESVPEENYHSTSVRVITERWDQGSLHEDVVLEHSLQSSTAAFRDLELSFVPFHFEPAGEDASARDEAVALADTSLEWQPVLRYDDTTISKQGFNRQGELVRNPGRQAIIRKLEGGTEALQGLGGSDQKPTTQLSACWIEYQINSPGQAPRVVRREVFDLIGPARRAEGGASELEADEQAIRERGVALLGTHRILVTSVEIPPVALQKAALELWAEQGPQLAALVRVAHNPDASEPLQRLYREPLVALDLVALASARHNLTETASKTYLASPNILSTHFTIDLSDGLRVDRGYDIVFNELAVVANSGLAPSELRLQQGVLDTTLEAVLSEPHERSGNAAMLFAQRGADTGAWRKVTEASELTGVPPEAQGRIAEALEAGRLVIAPSTLEAGVEAGWWEIDPQTGTTLGIGARGWGQTATERTIVETVKVGGTTAGGRKVGITAACKVALAYLRMNGWVFLNLSGGLTYTWQAMQFLAERGCSVVI